MATSKRLTVVNTKPPTADMGLFSYWGNQANTAFQQGWRPSESGADYARFRSNYNAPFNDVFIPDSPNERGRIEVIGKKGNKMDIVISDKQGKIRHTVYANVTPDFVQNYMTNNQSTVQQRMDNIANKRLSAISINKKKTF